MIGKKAATRLHKAFLLALSAFVALAAASAGGAAAQEMRVERVGVSAPVGGTAASVAAALPGAAGSFFGAPSLFAPPRTAPSAVTAAPVPAALPLPAAALSSPRSAAAPATSAESESPRNDGTGRVGRDAPSAGVLLRSAPDRALAFAAAADAPRAGETDRAGAERDFSALLGERLAAGEGSAVPTGLDARSIPSARPASSRLSAPIRYGAGIAAAVPAVLAIGLHAAAPTVLHLTAAHWHSISNVGYVIGNAGSSIFPLFEIYEALRGKKAPKFRAILGAVASLALGLINAPVLHKTFWGLQNVFGGVTLLVPLLIAARSGRVRGRGFRETGWIATGAVAVAAVLTIAAAAAVPSLLAALFTAAAVGKITLGIQIATSAMFLWMFLPDAVKALRGRAAGGFSRGFSLMFLVSSLGFMLWTLPSAWLFSDPHQGMYRMIFGVNAIYVATSYLSCLSAGRKPTT
ncbi:MAG: hypothetical protein ACHQ49_02420 [Elusimicrobiota bacterium]